MSPFAIFDLVVEFLCDNIFAVSCLFIFYILFSFFLLYLFDRS